MFWNFFENFSGLPGMVYDYGGLPGMIYDYDMCAILEILLLAICWLPTFNIKNLPTSVPFAMLLACLLPPLPF